MIPLCLVSHGQPAANPRLVRDGHALAEAGYSVRVVALQLQRNLVEHDRAIADKAKWQYEPVDFSARKNGTMSWNYVRARRRAAAALASRWPSEELVARAAGYASPELATEAGKQPADLFIAYQHNSLPAASWAAKRHGAVFALDAQDLLADCSAEPVALTRSIEMRYLRDCAYVSTMSEAAAKRLQETNNLCRAPIVLHNTPGLWERCSIVPPPDRHSTELISLYWFGQTIGSHSCADQVLDAMSRLPRRIRLVLRGQPEESFVMKLRKAAEDFGLSQQLEILPRAEPTEMVPLAAEHDILLGTQPGAELFHQMAIGNKVFTGMMAGLALALSDTIAHRELLSEVPGCGFLFQDRDVEGLTAKLRELLDDPSRLEAMKLLSWHHAEVRFNWEQESKILLQTVNTVLSRSLLEVQG